MKKFDKMFIKIESCHVLDIESWFSGVTRDYDKVLISLERDKFTDTPKLDRIFQTIYKMHEREFSNTYMLFSVRIACKSFNPSRLNKKYKITCDDDLILKHAEVITI